MTDIPNVSFSDVDDRYLEGSLEDRYDRAKVETQIQDAVDEVLSRWRDRIVSRLASGLLTPNSYRRVIASVVLRIVRNPEGYANESDGGYSYGLRVQVASGFLDFTANDIATLTGIQAASLPGTVGVGLDRGWG